MTPSEGRTAGYVLAHKRAVATAGALALMLSGAVTAIAPADAVNATHDNRVVRERPDWGTPHAMNGAVIAMVQLGDKVIAAGSFTRVSPSRTFKDTSDDLVRNRIFAFDADTGEIDRSFNPNLPGPANSLDTDGSAIYVSGRFGSVGGDKRFKRVVKLHPSGAVDTSFRAVPNKAVNEVVVRGDRVYIGGQFTQVKHENVWTRRSHLAALDADTGSVLSAVDLPFSGIYDPNVGGSTTIKRFDMTRSGDKLVAVGNFTRVGGQVREQVVVLDTGGTARVAPWSTDRYSRARSDCHNSFDNPMRDVDISPDSSFFVVSTTGGYAGGVHRATLCDTLARWDLDSTGNDPTWIDYTGGDTSYGVAVTGGVVYVGGHFRWMNNPFGRDAAGPGAAPRSGVAALDAVNGLPLSWNPGRARGVGAQAMYATDQGLWVGSDTTWFQGKRRGRISFLPLAGGTTLPSVAPATLPNTLFMAGGISGGDTLSKRPVDADGSPTAGSTPVMTSSEWSGVRGAFYVNGDLYYGTSAGKLMRRTFNPSSGASGQATEVELYNNGGTTWPNLGNVTGMFFDPQQHRLYYTVNGRSALRYRYFTPESRVVGALQLTAPSSVDFSSATGVTLAGGRVLYGSSDGALRSVPFTGGAVTGSPSTLSGDAWRYGALFVPND